MDGSANLTKIVSNLPTSTQYLMKNNMAQNNSDMTTGRAQQLLKLINLDGTMPLCGVCGCYCHNIKGSLTVDPKDYPKFVDIFNESSAVKITAQLQELGVPLRIEKHISSDRSCEITSSEEIKEENTIESLKVEDHSSTGISILKGTIINNSGNKILFENVESQVIDGYDIEEYDDPVYWEVSKKRWDTYTDLVKATKDVKITLHPHLVPRDRFHEWVHSDDSSITNKEEYHIPVTKTREVEYIEKVFVRLDKKTRKVPRYKTVTETIEKILYYATSTPALFSLHPIATDCNICSCSVCSQELLYTPFSSDEQWVDYFSDKNNETCLLCGGDHHGNFYKFVPCEPVFQMKSQGKLVENSTDKYFKFIKNEIYYAEYIKYNPCTICSCYRCIVYSNSNPISRFFYGLQFIGHVEDVEVLLYRFSQKNPSLRLNRLQIGKVLYKLKLIKQ